MPEELEFDMVIRGGRIVDGTCLPSFIGDLAIKDGRIADVGTVRGRGKEEFDATGLIVAPGVIDIHTHYDAQLAWDPYASQSCWHGVTSVVLANCGFGFAPVRPEDRERAMRRMTRVEAIPMELMSEHMRWDWVSQREQLESFERMGLGINIATYIPQSAVRAYVLGEDDTKREEITEDELEQMKELVRDGYRAGALGLSTDLNLIDRDYDGAKLPSLVASREETEALIGVAREFNVGSIEITPEIFNAGPKEISYFKHLYDVAGVPINFNALVQYSHQGDQWKERLDLLTEVNQTHRVYGLAVVHRLESIMNLRTYNLFDDMEHWNKFLACSYEEQVKNLSDPEVRKLLQHDVDTDKNRIWSGDWTMMKIFDSSHKDLIGKTITEISKERGTAPLDTFLDIALSENLETTFHMMDQVNPDDNASIAFLKHPYVMPGLSDGGAHTEFLSMGKYPTVVLSHWVRDKGVMSLEEAHWRLSAMSASMIGLEGVGTLQRGMPADVIVYDLDKLAVTPDGSWEKEINPGGHGHRFVQKSVGYRKIIINGVTTWEDGVCTGALPGRVMRTSAYEPDSGLQSEVGQKAKVKERVSAN